MLCFLCSVGSQHLVAQTTSTPDVNAKTSEAYEQFARKMDEERAEVEAQIASACETNLKINAEVLQFSSFAQLKLTANQPDDLITVTDKNGLVHYYGYATSEDVIVVPKETYYTVITTNSCGDVEELQEFNTVTRQSTDPYTATPAEYKAIRTYQKSGLSFFHSIALEDDISTFTKNRLLQIYTVGGAALPDGLAVASQTRLFDDVELPVQKDNNGDCTCVATRLPIEYELTDYRNIRGDLRITGRWTADFNQPFAGQRVRGDQYSYTEGPARLHNMKVSTNPGECVRPPYTYYWNEDNDIKLAGATTADPNEIGVQNFRASIEWNLVCTRNANGFRPGEWPCTRNVHFSWDYESTVEVAAEFVPHGGGWSCGKNRSARSVASDVATIILLEPQSGNMPEVLGTISNIIAAGCGAEYNGPDTEDVAEFVINVIDFATDDDPVLEREATARLARQIGEALQEDWNVRTECTPDMTGQRLSFSEERLVNRYTHTLVPGSPVRIELVASSNMQIGGQRKWWGEAEIRSSFQLSSILEGGFTRAEGAVGCCTPEAYVWMYSAVANRQGGDPLAITEPQLQNQVAAHFNSNGNISPNVWSETGHGWGYPIQQCANTVRVETISPLLEDDGSVESLFKVANSSRNAIGIYAHDQEIDWEGTKVQLYNLSGQLLSSIDLDHEGVGLMRTDGLPFGIYLLSTQLKDGSVRTQKIPVLW